MAGLRAGLIAFSCSKCREACDKRAGCTDICSGCQHRSYIKDSLGCEKPLETPAFWLGEDDEFYNCPRQFIMHNTYELIEQIDSYKSGLSTPPDFNNQSARFLLAVKVFDYYMSKFLALKQGK